MKLPFLKTKKTEVPAKIFEAPAMEARDIIAPASIVIKPDHFEFGKRFAKSFFIFSYPRYLNAAWLSPVINLDQPMDISFHVLPIDTGIVLKQLRRKVTEVQAELMDREEKGLIRDPALETAYQDLESLRDGLHPAQEKMFKFGLYLTVYGNTLEEIKNVETTLRSILESRLIYIKPSLYQQKEGFKAFIPNPFPPKDGFAFEPTILKKNDQATRSLGKLDGITKLLPDADFFLLMYLRKDAASSSQIEGTVATMVNAIEAEVKVNEKIPADVDDILHYIKARNYGVQRGTKDNFPMALRLVRELHKELMHKARATQYSDPGEFRKSQNWIGGSSIRTAHFVPPPHEEIGELLSDWEKCWHNASLNIPILIKIFEGKKL